MSRASAIANSLWYGENPLYKLLLPLSWIFAGVSHLRRTLFRLGWRKQHKMSVPVIVVGNISAGGVGKTPVVIDLVKRLQASGWRPGVVSRGYGGRVKQATQVSAQSDPDMVGDEPVLIASQTGAQVVVGAKRAYAARMLAALGVNVVVSDDGLQHYALARDLEICVVDAKRRHGNGQLLPSGPLREPVERLQSVDLVLLSGAASQAGEFGTRYSLGPLRHLNTGEARELSAFTDVQAVAGIGQPEKFFDALEHAGLSVERYAFADHHRYVPGDFSKLDSRPILMTEKDAVKCARFRDVRMWALEYHAHIDEAAWNAVMQRLGAAPKETH